MPPALRASYVPVLPVMRVPLILLAREYVRPASALFALFTDPLLTRVHSFPSAEQLGEMFGSCTEVQPPLSGAAAPMESVGAALSLLRVLLPRISAAELHAPYSP